MNKKISLILLLALPIMLLSCQKCYECKLYEYCLDCSGTINNIPLQYNSCYDTKEERTEAEQEIIASVVNAGGSCSCSQGTSEYIAGFDEEVCTSKKAIESDVDYWEALGYECTEQ